MNKLLKELQEKEKEYDKLEKQAQEYFSDGILTKLEFKRIKEEINEMRFRNNALQNEIKAIEGGEK